MLEFGKTIDVSKSVILPNRITNQLTEINTVSIRPILVPEVTKIVLKSSMNIAENIDLVNSKFNDLNLLYIGKEIEVDDNIITLIDLEPSCVGKKPLDIKDIEIDIFYNEQFFSNRK